MAHAQVTAPNMIDKRGRTFALAVWLGAGEVSLIICAMVMSAIFTETAGTFVTLVASYTTFAVATVTVLGARAGIDSWKHKPNADGAA